MVPIKHRICGNQVAWYLRDEPRFDDRLMAEDYMRMDGTQPQNGDIFSEHCAHCGVTITRINDIVRDFNDKHPNIKMENQDETRYT